jgi:hypothetical protein
MGSLQGIITSHSHQFFELTMEGDSQLIIDILTHLQHGSPPRKISDNWHLETLLDLLQPVIENIVGLVPSHIIREENNLADYLENEGVSKSSAPLDSNWDNLVAKPLKQHCQYISLSYLNHLDKLTNCMDSHDHEANGSGTVMEGEMVVLTIAPTLPTTSFIHSNMSGPSPPRSDPCL